MQVRPKNLAVDAITRLQHVVMIVPVNAQEDEAQHIGKQRWNYWLQRMPIRSLRHSQFENHDRN